MTTAQLFLVTGSVDIGLTIAVVEGIILVLKPIIDTWKPKRDPLWPNSPFHDSVLEVIISLMTGGAVLLFQWAGPIGLHSSQAVVALLVQTIIALLSEFGLYAKIRGPVPATPVLTPAAVAAAQTHVQLYRDIVLPSVTGTGSSNVGAPPVTMPQPAWPSVPLKGAGTAGPPPPEPPA